MNDPPDQTAEFNAANLLSVGGMTFAKCSRKMSSFSFKALICIFKDDPLSLQGLLSYCDKQLQIHIAQIHRPNIFAQLQEFRAYQMSV